MMLPSRALNNLDCQPPRVRYRRRTKQGRVASKMITSTNFDVANRHHTHWSQGFKSLSKPETEFCVLESAWGAYMNPTSATSAADGGRATPMAPVVPIPSQKFVAVGNLTATG